MLKESGVNRFDVLSKIDAPNEFMLIEGIMFVFILSFQKQTYHVVCLCLSIHIMTSAYKTTLAADDHKLTPHYNDWKDFVQPLMVCTCCFFYCCGV